MLEEDGLQLGHIDWNTGQYRKHCLFWLDMASIRTFRQQEDILFVNTSEKNIKTKKWWFFFNTLWAHWYKLQCVNATACLYIAPHHDHPFITTLCCLLNATSSWITQKSSTWFLKVNSLWLTGTQSLQLSVQSALGKWSLYVCTVDRSAVTT